MNRSSEHSEPSRLGLRNTIWWQLYYAIHVMRLQM